MIREPSPPLYLHDEKLYVNPDDGKVPFVVKYPTDFDMTGGMGNRVLFLNRYLLKQYATLGQTIRYRRSKILVYNNLIGVNPEVITIKTFVLDRMKNDIYDASASIEDMLHVMRHHIKEIDAIAGPQGYFIPQEFKEYLGPLESLVESKSLQYLAEPQHYVDEISLNGKLQLLAYNVNRIKYFSACNCEEMAKACGKYLKSTYCSLSQESHNSMPSQLREEAYKMVSHMWSQMKAEALENINNEVSDSDEEILCLSDTELDPLKREFVMGQDEEAEFVMGQDEEAQSEKSIKAFVGELFGDSKKSRQSENNNKDLKKVTEEDRGANEKNEDKLKELIEEKGAKDKEHDKGKCQMRKEQQLKKVIEEKDKEANEKKQGIGKCQIFKFKFVGGDDEEGEKSEDEDEDEGDCYDDDYPYDTSDSNAEDNPRYDYPDEESPEHRIDEFDHIEESLDDGDDEDDQSDQ